MKKEPLLENENVTRFIDLVDKVTKENGVKLYLPVDKEFIAYGENPNALSSGYFIDIPHPELAVAMKKPVEDWLPVMAHEYCHMMQWLDKDPLWTNLINEDGEDVGAEFDDWIDGAPREWHEIFDMMITIRDMELDCERRTMALIYQLKLPIDLNEYAQKAASYVHLYNWMAIRRLRNEPRKAPYLIPEVWSEMPMTLEDDGFFECLPEYVSDLFDKYCT